jgi:hypothetical protein
VEQTDQPDVLLAESSGFLTSSHFACVSTAWLSQHSLLLIPDYYFTMAPNRKSLTALTQSLNCMDLVSTVQSKYLPLTHPSEAGSQGTFHGGAPLPQDSLSYWEWSSDEVVEPTICVLSSENIVSNLIQAGHALDEEDVGTTNPDHDSYWSEHQAAPTSPLHASANEEYWSWDESTTGDYWGWESRPSRVAKLTMAMHPALMQRKNHCRVLGERDDQYWSWGPQPLAASTCHSYWAW